MWYVKQGNVTAFVFLEKTTKKSSEISKRRSDKTEYHPDSSEGEFLSSNFKSMKNRRN